MLFLKSLFLEVRMARSKVCILKGFSRFVVCLDVQDGFAFGPLPFEYNCIKAESYLFSDTSAVNLMVGWSLLA